jgi:hypothetical protein
MPLAGRVAIMQPYFAPYAGYFRLFAATELFVIYDCVQFPRRGWVHRNRLPGSDGILRWLTLPLDHASREARICDMRFRGDAKRILSDELPRFPSLSRLDPEIARALLECPAEAATYLERLLGLCCKRMGIPFRTLRSSSLGIDPSLHGEERIIAIAKALGATRYLNAPGGRALYGAERFAAHGLKLEFLPEYRGSTASILHRMAMEPAEDLRRDIEAACV